MLGRRKNELEVNRVRGMMQSDDAYDVISHHHSTHLYLSQLLSHPPTRPLCPERLDLIAPPHTHTHTHRHQSIRSLLILAACGQSLLKTLALLHSFNEQLAWLQMRLLRKVRRMNLQCAQNILQADLFLSPPPANRFQQRRVREREVD
jgi:hypothetical protein